MKDPRIGLACAASLAVAASAYFGCLLLAEPVQTLPFDAEHFYFPMARRLLDEGSAYLLSSDSVRSTPVSYLWPALFGIDVDVLRIAHVIAGAALCLLAFDTARLLHSPWAGAIAAWGLALSPLLRPLIPPPVTEAPFLLFTAIWWWGLTAYLQGRKPFLIPAMIGGSLSILTRQVWLYPVLLLVLSAAALLLRRNRTTASRVLVAHAIILVAPAIFMLKNHVTVDHAVVATGAGSAIYFGQYPLTGGFEPPLVGLSYDDGYVLSRLDVDHKSALGDKVLTAIGLQWLRERPALDSAKEMPARIGRVLFLPNRGLTPTLFNNRALRIVTVCLALVALISVRRNPMILLLGTGLAVQSLQLSVVLFNDRYTIGTLDYGLTLLASVGLAWMAAPRVAGETAAPRADHARPALRWRRAARALGVSSAVAAMCAAAVAVGYRVQRFVPLEEARMPREPTLVRSLGPEPPPSIRDSDGVEVGYDAEIATSGPDMLFRLAIPALHVTSTGNVMWLIRMSIVPPPANRCRHATLAYFERSTQTTGPARTLMLTDDGAAHDYVLGAHADTSVLYPRGEGELQLQLACASGTRVRLERAVLYESRIPEIYALRAEDIARRFR